SPESRSAALARDLCREAAGLGHRRRGNPPGDTGRFTKPRSALAKEGGGRRTLAPTPRIAKDRRGGSPEPAAVRAGMERNRERPGRLSDYVRSRPRRGRGCHGALRGKPGHGKGDASPRSSSTRRATARAARQVEVVDPLVLTW